MLKEEFKISSWSFKSHGTTCNGYKYIPISGKQKYPAIIMAHGFGATIEVGLPGFAEYFVKVGYAIFMFDYRHFGLSKGRHRQHINPFDQLNDWEIAINTVRQEPIVDENKIVLWGSSYSSGHVLNLASKLENIMAVIALNPFISGKDSMKNLSGKQLIKVLMYSLKNFYKLKKTYIPIFGEPDSLAAESSTDAWNWFSNHAPDVLKQSENNRCTLLSIHLVPFYSPLRKIESINCPVLMIPCKYDDITGYAGAIKAAKRINHCEFHTVDCGHFGIYFGKHFEEAIKLEISFLKKILR